MMIGGVNLLRIIPRPPTRILAMRRVATLVLLGTLLLAASARAAAPAAEPAPEASAPAASAAESASEASAPVASAAEPAPEASPPAEPIAEPTPEVSAPTEPELAPEAAPPAPVAEPAPAPVAGQAPEAAAPVEPTKEAKEDPATEPTKEATEVDADKLAREQGAESPSSPSATSPVAESADNSTDSATPETSSALGGPITTILPDVSEDVPTSSAASSVSTAALARTIAAQRAEDFNRELGGLGSSLTDGYTATGSDDRSLLPAAFVDGLVAGTAGRAGAPADDDPGGSRGENPPIVVPPPGPTPNGAFGGAAPGGSGIALAGFPAFAGHLLLGAPLAMHRLRLSFQPWLTAFFVLIPERPG
jgi:hypothetical protein